MPSWFHRAWAAIGAALALVGPYNVIPHGVIDKVTTVTGAAILLATSLRKVLNIKTEASSSDNVGNP